MRKTELIDSIAAKSGLPKAQAAKALEATLTSITEALAARDSVTITGFGVFKPKERPQREGRNPRDGIDDDDCCVDNCRVQHGRGSKECLEG
jgi:DNA-binding protein HU-beta